MPEAKAVREAEVKATGDAIVGTLEVAAPPEKVFAALTQPDQLMQWWGAGSGWTCFGWHIDLRRGGRWSTRFADPEGKMEHETAGEFIEVDPPRRLSYTWQQTLTPDVPVTRVQWDLEKRGDHTLVTMTHSGFTDASKDRDGYVKGWPGVLRGLEFFFSPAYGESGKADVRSSADAVFGTIQVDAPPEAVFEAVTTSSQLVQWWGEKGKYHITDWKNDLRVGGKWRSDGVSADGQKFSVEGEYTEIHAPKVLGYTWKGTFDDHPPTQVRWVFEPKGKGTLVTIQHSGFVAGNETIKKYAGGWPSVLKWLNDFTAEGLTVATRG